MRTKVLAAVLVLTIAALTSGFQSNTEWVRYTSEEGCYSALIPQQPTLSKQEVTNPLGEKTTQYMANASDSYSFYRLAYFDYTPNIVFSLDKARDGVLNAIKGTSVKEEVITLGGNPGRELKFSSKNGDFELLHRVRFYDIGRRIYILQHIFLKVSDSPAIAAKTAAFFDSFKVTTVQ